MAKPEGINLAVAPQHKERAAEASRRRVERLKREGAILGRQPKPSRATARLEPSAHACNDLARALGYPPAVIPPIKGKVHLSPQDVEPPPPPKEKGKKARVYREVNGIKERRCAKCFRWLEMATNFRYRKDRNLVHNECHACEKQRRHLFYWAHKK